MHFPGGRFMLPSTTERVPLHTPDRKAEARDCLIRNPLLASTLSLSLANLDAAIASSQFDRGRGLFSDGGFEVLPSLMLARTG